MCVSACTELLIQVSVAGAALTTQVGISCGYVQLSPCSQAEVTPPAGEEHDLQRGQRAALRQSEPSPRHWLVQGTG